MAFVLTTTNVAIVSIALLLFHRIGLLLYRFYFHPLSKFPGPKYLSASALSQFYYQNIKGRFYKDVRDLHEQYGSIVRVAPNELSIDGSIGWNDIFGHKKAGEQEFEKDVLWYHPLDEGKGIGGSGFQDIVIANRDDHRRQRRVVSHAFSDTALIKQEGIIKSYVDLLMQRLKEHSTEGKTLDAVKWYNYTTFDIIGDLAFGDPFNCLESSTMHPWVSMIFDVLKAGTQLRIFGQYPSLKPFISLVMSPKLQNTIVESTALTSAKLEKRLALGPNTERGDFLSYILRHNDEKGLKHPEILGNSEAFIIAGSETTATLLSGLTYYLSQYPETWNRLKTEVRESFESEDEINMRSTGSLPYLHACIEEAFRVYPPVPTMPPRTSPGTTVNGVFIPKGTKLWIHQWSTSRRSCNFLLPDTFIPERWLPPSHPYYDSRFENDNKACMKPFSHGARNCVGKNLAYSEMRLIMARLAWNFEIETTPECKSWPEDQKVFTVFQKPPLFMKLAPSTQAR
ncbi:Cytochrome P450 monooxygenase aclL [Lachnellula suecica]|uniref:Cytochrome P450 monooxygenase aclL n=1 Tax=Lachnellula suecica TaxID=602035 RepID=A0A8T9CG28_9HELO|nr:Cytochrome P450 monooxygenase aclL [Lachnellula suecica]